MVKMLQVRRPAFTELTMLSRFEAQVRYDVLTSVISTVGDIPCLCQEVSLCVRDDGILSTSFPFLIFFISIALRSSAKGF